MPLNNRYVMGKHKLFMAFFGQRFNLIINNHNGI